MKKLMAKITCFILTVAVIASMAFGLVACDGGGVNNSSGPQKGELHNEIKNIIVIIGDGMGTTHVRAGEMYEETNYCFTSWHRTEVNTDSFGGIYNDEIVYVLTDSAAGGTAIATGNVTINGYVGTDHEGNVLETIMDEAKSKGKTTAVVSTDNIFGATPASFSGHSSSRGNTAEIVESQIKSSNVDLLCGHRDTQTVSTSTQALASEYGYTYCDDYTNVTSTLQADKAYWQFDMAGTTADVQLEEVTVHVLDFVSRNENGFVMMLEQAYIDKYSHNNDFNGVIKSVSSLNKTVEVVMNWIGDRTDTAVLITADHETGGLQVGYEGEYVRTFTTIAGRTCTYFFNTGDHTPAYVGLYTYNIAPNFSNFEFYKSNANIKNIETYQIMYNLLQTPNIY